MSFSELEIESIVYSIRQERSLSINFSPFGKFTKLLLVANRKIGS